MADLTVAKAIPTRTGRRFALPMLTGITLAKGALVNITAAGFATHATNTALEQCAGTASETKVAVGASGNTLIQVDVGDCEQRTLSTNFAATDLGAMTFVGADDSIITLTPGAGVKVGRITEGVVGSPLVWVQRPMGFGPVGEVIDATFGSNEQSHLTNLI